MSLISKGFAHAVPGRVGTNFRDNPRLKLTARNDWRYRRPDELVTSIMVHTRWGMPVKVKAGAGRNIGWDLDLAARFSKDTRAASSHVAVDGDGSYGCFADLASIATYHGNHLCGITVGIEMFQETDGTVYQETLEATADIIDVVTRLFGIQRQYPTERTICRRFGNIVKGDKYTFVPGANRGRDFSGICGHRNATRNRGAGDPDDQVFEVLRLRGYEPYAVDQGEDIDVWEARQRELGLPEEDVDGVPESHTRALIRFKRGNPAGLWVKRPGDELFDPEHPAE